MDVIDSNEIKQYFVEALKDTSFFEIKKEGRTSIQWNEQLSALMKKHIERKKSLINKTIAITCSIIDIQTASIKVLIPNSLNAIPFRATIGEYDSTYSSMGTFYTSIFAFFGYKNEDQKNELLKFNVGDVVKLSGKIVDLIGVEMEAQSFGTIYGDPSPDSIYFQINLDLTSIEMVERPKKEGEMGIAKDDLQLAILVGASIISFIIFYGYPQNSFGAFVITFLIWLYFTKDWGSSSENTNSGMGFGPSISFGVLLGIFVLWVYLAIKWFTG